MGSLSSDEAELALGNELAVDKVQFCVSLHHLGHFPLNMVQLNVQQRLQLENSDAPAMLKQAVLDFPLELRGSDVPRCE